MEWSDKGGGDFEQAPIGTHIARCIKLIDIGTQKGDYQGKVTFKRQVIVGWELPTTLMQDGDYAGKPFIVSKFYTASLGEKANLRKDLINWRGRDFTPEELAGFDPKKILGAPCMISLTLNDKKKSRVSGVISMPKGMDIPTAINELVYFSLEENDFDRNVYESLSEGIKKMISISPEYLQLSMPKQENKNSEDSFSNFEDFEDSIPF